MKKICPKCKGKELYLVKYNDKGEAIIHGTAGALGSGLIAAGIIGPVVKIGIGAKIVGIIGTIAGGIAAPVAIPTAAILGGAILAHKAYSKEKKGYKCKKCGYTFE